MSQSEMKYIIRFACNRSWQAAVPCKIWRLLKSIIFKNQCLGLFTLNTAKCETNLSSLHPARNETGELHSLADFVPVAYVSSSGKQDTRNRNFEFQTCVAICWRSNCKGATHWKEVGCSYAIVENTFTEIVLSNQCTKQILLKCRADMQKNDRWHSCQPS